MSANECVKCDRPRTKGLVDGRSACGYCNAWLRECEARSLLALDLNERRERLWEIEQKRGQAAAHELRVILLALWKKNRPAVQVLAERHEEVGTE